MPRASYVDCNTAVGHPTDYGMNGPQVLYCGTSDITWDLVGQLTSWLTWCRRLQAVRISVWKKACVLCLYYGAIIKIGVLNACATLKN